MTSLLLATVLLESTVLAPSPERMHPKLIVDIGLAAGVSAIVAVGKPDIRQAIFDDGSLSNIAENFAHPVRQVRIGTQRDSDPFWVNNLAHPGLFAIEGFWLKHRGYRSGAAFLFTQVHSVIWEFAVEGSAFEPSGKDLIADAAGAAVGIWVIWPILHRASAGGPSLSIAPRFHRGGVGLAIAGTF
jgi:hypothetical protein